MCSQEGAPAGNLKAANALLIYFGQLLDHDFALTLEGTGEELNIEVPEGDLVFDEAEMEFLRSQFVRGEAGFREFANSNTAWLDLSNVYGDTLERSLALRALEGGLLRSQGDAPQELMPLNRDLAGGGVPTAGTDPDVFACGDLRCNENHVLIAFTTLFVREHNRLARELQRRSGGSLGDELLFQLARLINILQYQNIIFEEYLPALLGFTNMADPSFAPPFDASLSQAQWEAIEPSTDLAFSTCAFRFGHSGIPDTIPLATTKGEVKEEIVLADAFFQPGAILSDPDLIDSIFNGLRVVQHEFLDTKIVDSLRNALFANVGSRLDLASLNLQRGRDHGVPGISAFRPCSAEDCFFELTGDSELAEALRELYHDDYDAVDCWVGGLAEAHRFGDSQLGETFSRMIVQQFARFRDADRLWGQRISAELLGSGDEGLGLVAELISEGSSLAELIARNTKASLKHAPPAFFTSPFFPSEVTSSSVRVEFTGRGQKGQVVDKAASLEVSVEGPGAQSTVELAGVGHQAVLFQGLQPDTEYSFSLCFVSSEKRRFLVEGGSKKCVEEVSLSVSTTSV